MDNNKLKTRKIKEYERPSHRFTRYFPFPFSIFLSIHRTLVVCLYLVILIFVVVRIVIAFLVISSWLSFIFHSIWSSIANSHASIYDVVVFTIFYIREDIFEWRVSEIRNRKRDRNLKPPYQINAKPTTIMATKINKQRFKSVFCEKKRCFYSSRFFLFLTNKLMIMRGRDEHVVVIRSELFL